MTAGLEVVVVGGRVSEDACYSHFKHKQNKMKTQWAPTVILGCRGANVNTWVCLLCCALVSCRTKPPGLNASSGSTSSSLRGLKSFRTGCVRRRGSSAPAPPPRRTRACWRTAWCSWRWGTMGDFQERGCGWCLSNKNIAPSVLAFFYDFRKLK